MLGRSNALVARNGHTLVVGIVARISGCQNQKELSLDDQVDHAKQVVADHFEGPVEYRVIATKAKGERLDRPELAEVEAMLRTKEMDMLVVEDLGRIVRGVTAARLCGIAVDHGTRVLAPNDCIDTAEPTWEEDVISACRDHVGHNSQTSKRLKHKLMNRFEKFGGATARPTYGYIVPPGAKTYDDWQKEPTATAIYQEWFARLRETLNCSAVADWLNQTGVPTGPYCRRKTWDGAMVRRVTANPLLKGMPSRGSKHTVKHNESGRRVAVRNPKGPKFRQCPQLAHVEPAVWDEVNALLKASNKGLGRKLVNGADPRQGVPRKRTRWPGQYARCRYCGRQYVWGGNGMTENLMCSGAREWRCWNSLGFNGALAATRLTEAITAHLYRLDGLDEQFRAMVEQANRDGGADQTRRWDQLLRDEEALKKRHKNLAAGVAEYGPKPMFEQMLAEVEAAERELVRERRGLEALRSRTLQLPESAGALRRMLEEQFRLLPINSPEFGDLMRQLVPQFHVYLVRLCDGGHLLPRARVQLALAGGVADAEYVPGLNELLTSQVTLDLFDHPPQRERIRQDAVRLTAKGFDQREIAKRLPENATQTAVQRALALERAMRAQSLATPYVSVLEPPGDYSKLRRHLNGKFRFTPLEGYEPPPI